VRILVEKGGTSGTHTLYTEPAGLLKEISMSNEKPWTKEEHERFLQALEKFGSLQSGAEVAKLAKHVGNGRTQADCLKHAEKYLLKLQQAKKDRQSEIEEPRKRLDDRKWTWEQEMEFEKALTLYPSDPSEDRWKKVSKHLAGAKSPNECRKRYELLVLDIISLTAGDKIEVHYKASAGGKK
jgi:hypothetical protein